MLIGGSYDPLTAAVLSLPEIKGMVNEMFEQNRELTALSINAMIAMR